MIKRKSTLKYYFSVEGETEQWYLEWLALGVFFYTIFGKIQILQLSKIPVR